MGPGHVREILPVQYCHLILTVPQPITQLAMLNPRVVYPLVMRVGAESVLRCGRELFQVELRCYRCCIPGANSSMITFIPTACCLLVACA